MYKLLYILLSIMLMTDYGEAKADRISGGLEATKRDQFPFFAQLKFSIRYNANITGVGTCGATLIHPQWILTAAHCFIEFKDKILQHIKENKLVVIAGTYKRYDESDGYVNYIKKVFIHPRFEKWVKGKSDYVKYDVALAMLRNKYSRNKYVQRAYLPHPRKIDDPNTSRCKNGTIVGIGLKRPTVISTAEDFPEKVMYITAISKTRYELEMEVEDPPVDSVFYTESEYLKDHILRGDSGGPFVCQNKEGNTVVYGVVSLSMTFSNYIGHVIKHIGIYEEVDKHMDFILNTVKGVKIYKGKRKDQSSINTNNVSSFYCIFLSLIFGVIQNMD